MTEDVTAIKEKGNACLREEKYEEAVLRYSHAIKLDPKNHSLYSNRSLAFLKMQQYYLALEDAKEAIWLKPDWAKGYFRKAEVEFETFNFNDALLSYKIALKFQPNDPSLEEGVKKTKEKIKKEKAFDDQISWIGAAIGIFVGVLIEVADQIFTQKPILKNPILMVLLTIGTAVLGYFIANVSRQYIKRQRTSLLDPPVNLFKEKDVNSDNLERDKEMRTRYTKAQTRHRLRKGRS